MNEIRMGEILEDVRTIECVIMAYEDLLVPQIRRYIPETESDLLAKTAAVSDIIDTYFRKIHARVSGQDTISC